MPCPGRIISCSKQGNGFETLSKSDRHDVRIALKRLRYALDFFGSIFRRRASRRSSSKRLARLQDDLGRMNDVAVAETMLARTCRCREPTDRSSPRRCVSQGQLGLCRRSHPGLAPAPGRGNRPSIGQGLELHSSAPSRFGSGNTTPPIIQLTKAPIENVRSTHPAHRGLR